MDSFPLDCQRLIVNYLDGAGFFVRFTLASRFVHHHSLSLISTLLVTTHTNITWLKTTAQHPSFTNLKEISVLFRKYTVLGDTEKAYGHLVGRIASNSPILQTLIIDASYAADTALKTYELWDTRSLTRLELTNHPLTLFKDVNIFNWITSLPQLSELSFNHVGTDLSPALDILPRISSLKRLELRNSCSSGNIAKINLLSTLDYLEIHTLKSDYISWDVHPVNPGIYLPNLSHLSLKDIPLLSSGLKAILSNTKLRSLEIGNSYGDILLTPDVDLNTTLTSLSISDFTCNNLHGLPVLWVGLGQNRALRSLALRQMENVDGLKACLAELKAHNVTIESIDLSGTALDGAAWSDLKAWLVSRPTISKLRLEGCPRVPIDIVTGIIKEAHLTDLDLARINFKQTRAKLFEAIYANETLKTLRLASCNLCLLDTLLRKIKETAVLTSLDLWNNYLPSKLFPDLVDALKANKTLLHLNLGMNPLGPAASLTLARELYLCNSQIRRLALPTPTLVPPL